MAASASAPMVVASSSLDVEDEEALLFEDPPALPRRAWRRGALLAAALGAAGALAGVAALKAHGRFFTSISKMDASSAQQKEQHDVIKVSNNGATNCFYETLGEEPVCYNCFPGHSVAEVFDTGFVPLSKLRVGERVRVGAGDGDFEPVMSFIHAGGVGRRSQHLKIDHAAGGSLRASHNHLIFLAGGSAVAAGSVRVGDDLLLADGRRAKVTGVGREEAETGMFAPVTPSGKVVVDGVLASAYATVHGINLPHGAMHASFFPVRVFHALGLTCDGCAASSERDELSFWAALLHERLQVDRLLVWAGATK
eukprot:TRINITY_DN27979_c0_g1_i1.p1 TRINITY_DN27979_c0_g1~~TRINITY_DN27979_c0_g1_i1.p1  ORF type:complete len:310 (+),score=84.35 TRINITY_DN27979_c0_g1_i1:71-1000(+)